MLFKVNITRLPVSWGGIWSNLCVCTVCRLQYVCANEWKFKRLQHVFLSRLKQPVQMSGTVMLADVLTVHVNNAWRHKQWCTLNCSPGILITHCVRVCDFFMSADRERSPAAQRKSVVLSVVCVCVCVCELRGSLLCSEMGCSTDGTWQFKFLPYTHRETKETFPISLHIYCKL